MDVVAPVDSIISNKMLNAIDSPEVKDEALTFSSPPPESIVPDSDNFDHFNLVEMARQISLYEHNLFRSIKPHEFLFINDSKKSPNIERMNNWELELSKWVASRIVTEKKLEKRSKLIKKFISILIELFKLSNFNACNEILEGLTMNPVFRLTQTWANIKKKYPKFFRVFEEMQDLFSPRENFKGYKEAMGKVAPPCLPNLNLITMEFVNVDQMDEFIVMDGKEFINIEKLIKISEIITQVSLYRQIYNVSKVDVIHEFFSKGLIHLEDDVLLAKSNDIESQNNESSQRKSVLIRKENAKNNRKSILVKEKEKEKKKKK
jgi:hypothetical protein